MSRPRYQRSLPGGALGNGMNDGWLRPDGAAPPAYTDGRNHKYGSRGVSYRCRYWAFWVSMDISRRSDLHCNFDSLEEAQAEIAAHPDVYSGGVWDRRDQRWVV